jgi:hypothetical protein
MNTQFALQSAVNFPVALWMDAPAHFAYQGCVDGTFKLYMFSEDNTSHRVDLYAQGSNSMPWQNPQNKWSHLNPQWRFTDLSGNVIKEITLSNPSTAEFNGTVGYKSSAEFYYIDDMPSQFPCGTLLIWAVADFAQYPTQKDAVTNMEWTPGYANSKVIAAVPYLINELTPTRFDITRDGLNPMFDFYWINTPISHILSVVGTTHTGSCTAVMKNVPPIFSAGPTNYLGTSAGPITRFINGIPSASLTWTPDNASSYLSATDYQDFIVGGYLKENVKSKITANDVAVSAMGRVYYENIPVHYPYLWISNPENNTLNRIYTPCVNEDWLSPDAPFLTELGQRIFDSTYLQVTAPTTVMSLTGFHGVYGIAISKYKDIWCTDAESDKVYKFDLDGVLLSSFNFGENNTYNFGITGGCTPAGVAIDGLSGVWITFFDSASVICLDEYTGSVKYIINPGDIEVPYTDPTFKPVLAEPDKQSNVWVTYTNTVCSVMMKYDKINLYTTPVSTIMFAPCSNPMDIHITKTNDVWVSLAHHAGPPYGFSSVVKYASGSVSSPISGFSALNPSYLAMDNMENLWFTQSGNTLTRVSSAGVITNWSVGAPINSSFYLPPYNLFLESALEGLCCDVYDKVWIINSIDNSLYTITNDEVRLGVKIQPDQNLSWYNDGGCIYTEVNEANKSAQAFGDWSGNKWIRKYSNLDATYLSAALIGGSNQFNIYDFNGYDVRRFNESWDAVNEVKKYARSPHIVDNPLYWDGYMKSVWGDASSPQGTGFGREAYERTANFVVNHADINACNVEQLYSLAQYTDVPIDEYGVSFPPELRRIMDIGSINQQLLWGSRCKCNKNISNIYTTYLSGTQTVATNYKCDACGHYHPGNMGSSFNPLTYMVTAYVPFIIDDRTNTNNKYQLLTPPVILSSSASPIPLTQIEYDVYIAGGLLQYNTNPKNSNMGQGCGIEQLWLSNQVGYLSSLEFNLSFTHIPSSSPQDIYYSSPPTLSSSIHFPVYDSIEFVVRDKDGNAIAATAIDRGVYNGSTPLSGDDYTLSVNLSYGQWHVITDVGNWCIDKWGGTTYVNQLTSDLEYARNVKYYTLSVDDRIPSEYINGDFCNAPITTASYIYTYPLSSYYNLILPSVFDFGVSANQNDFMQAITYFCFYDYVSIASCTEQIAGIINWDDQYTTLNENASSINEWYGSGQTLERIINYVLHKGLGLIGNS